MTRRGRRISRRGGEKPLGPAPQQKPPPPPPRPGNPTSLNNPTPPDYSKKENVAADHLVQDVKTADKTIDRAIASVTTELGPAQAAAEAAQADGTSKGKTEVDTVKFVLKKLGDSKTLLAFAGKEADAFKDAVMNSNWDAARNRVKDMVNYTHGAIAAAGSSHTAAAAGAKSPETLKAKAVEIANAHKAVVSIIDYVPRALEAVAAADPDTVMGEEEVEDGAPQKVMGWEITAKDGENWETKTGEAHEAAEAVEEEVNAMREQAKNALETMRSLQDTMNGLPGAKKMDKGVAIIIAETVDMLNEAHETHIKKLEGALGTDKSKWQEAWEAADDINDAVQKSLENADVGINYLQRELKKGPDGGVFGGLMGETAVRSGTNRMLQLLNGIKRARAERAAAELREATEVWAKALWAPKAGGRARRRKTRRRHPRRKTSRRKQ